MGRELAVSDGYNMWPTCISTQPVTPFRHGCPLALTMEPLHVSIFWFTTTFQSPILSAAVSSQPSSGNPLSGPCKGAVCVREAYWCQQTKQKGGGVLPAGRERERKGGRERTEKEKEKEKERTEKEEWLAVDKVTPKNNAHLSPGGAAARRFAARNRLHL